MAKFTVDQLDGIQVPDDLEGNNKELELFFSSNEPDVHSDHKTVAAQEETLELVKQRLRKLTIENDDLAMLGPHRRLFSWFIFGFGVLFTVVTIVYLIAATVPVNIQVGELMVERTYVQVDDSVLKILLGTSLAQVVGLMYVVARWLFPSRSPHPLASNEAG